MSKLENTIFGAAFIAVAGLGSLGMMTLIKSCEERQANKINVQVNYENRPKDFYDIRSKDLFTNIIAWDLDGYKTIDEAIRLRERSTGLSGGLAILVIVPYAPKKDWEHLVAKGYEGKTFVTTDNTVEMKSEEREALTNTYKVLIAPK